MTLTQPDLQAIDSLIKKRIGPLERGQASLQKGQSQLEKDQAKLEKGMAQLQKGQSQLEKKIDVVDLKINKIDKKFDLLFNFLDKDVSSTRRRLNHHDKLLEVDTTNL